MFCHVERSRNIDKSLMINVQFELAQADSNVHRIFIQFNVTLIIRSTFETAS
jgi:hypothetical protein